MMIAPCWSSILCKERCVATTIFLLLLVVDAMVGAFHTFAYRKSIFNAASVTSNDVYSRGIGTADRRTGLQERTYNKKLSAMGETNEQPQVMATGFSNLGELQAALEDAFRSAMEKIPANVKQIDFVMVAVSSLYDGSSSATPITAVVPVLLQQAVQDYNVEIINLIGCTSAGLLGSLSSPGDDTSSLTTIETEDAMGVVVTLCVLPEVEVMTFHVQNDAVPDDITNLSQEECFKALFGTTPELPSINDTDDISTAVCLLPSPAFLNHLDDFLKGLQVAIPAESQTFGAVASTVSSLSRARLFHYSKISNVESQSREDDLYTHGRGCVGVMFRGDIQVDILVARGAKPVGGTYRIGDGQESTIRSLILDHVHTDYADAESSNWIKYAARTGTPKPPLAEANYLLKHLLTDDEAHFMRRTLLIGVEQNNITNTKGEIERLICGEDYSYEVYQVASAGLKDGSVTLPLDCVNLKVGQRVRFFVREGGYAKRELHALWTAYNESSSNDLITSGCFMFPSLDRGTKIFGGRPGYESGFVSSKFLPNINSMSGFFANGVIGPSKATSIHQKLLSSKTVGEGNQITTKLHSSATCFALIKSRSSRPVFHPVQAKDRNKDKGIESLEEDKIVNEDIILKHKSPTKEQKAPRSSDGELILRRREIHSGRSLTVSTVEWSVAEKKAQPTSALEGWMWDKETEVDRFRERVPLANLLSQVKMLVDTSGGLKPKDWIGSTFSHSNASTFTIIPELKRTEPRRGALRARYNPSVLVEEFSGVANSLSVNCDGVVFGGSLDISAVRSATSLPILISDLILYPYQLYQLRLKGADAVSFIAAALSSKDLVYLTKIASSLGLQSVVSVTSEAQLKRVMSGSAGSIAALVVSNRNWEDFSVDDSGQQALHLLQSDTMASFRLKFPDIPILVEGHVGLIKERGSAAGYIISLKQAGASGAIVGSALAACKISDLFI